jgi:hypothetical protein
MIYSATHRAICASVLLRHPHLPGSISGRSLSPGRRLTFRLDVWNLPSFSASHQATSTYIPHFRPLIPIQKMALSSRDPIRTSIGVRGIPHRPTPDPIIGGITPRSKICTYPPGAIEAIGEYHPNYGTPSSAHLDRRNDNGQPRGEHHGQPKHPSAHRASDYDQYELLSIYGLTLYESVSKYLFYDLVLAYLNLGIK